jgi:hypothetical protein
VLLNIWVQFSNFYHFLLYLLAKECGLCQGQSSLKNSKNREVSLARNMLVVLHGCRSITHRYNIKNTVRSRPYVLLHIWPRYVVGKLNVVELLVFMESGEKKFVSASCLAVLLDSVDRVTLLTFLDVLLVRYIRKIIDYVHIFVVSC